MSVVSNSKCYYFESNQFVELSIPESEVVMIRASGLVNSCVLTHECFYIVRFNRDGNQMVIKRKPPDYRILDLCSLHEQHDDAYRVLCCVTLDDQCCARVYDIDMRVRFEVKGVIAICSTVDLYVILTTDCKLFARVRDNPEALEIRIPDDLCIQDLVRMSCRIDTESEYTLVLWSERRMVKMTVSKYTQQACGPDNRKHHEYLRHSELLFDVPLIYAESTANYTITLTDDGNVSVNGKIVSSDCVSIARLSPMHIIWLGVKNDGTYELITSRGVEDGKNFTPITLTNTDTRVIKNLKSARS